MTSPSYVKGGSIDKRDLPIPITLVLTKFQRNIIQCQPLPALSGPLEHDKVPGSLLLVSQMKSGLQSVLMTCKLSLKDELGGHASLRPE